MIECPKEVRTAVPDDRYALLDLFRELHGEVGQAPMDELRVREIIWRGVHQRRAIVGVIEGKPDKTGKKRIEGSIGLFIEPWWYSSADRIIDLWNFVGETYRRSTHAKHLLEFAKYAAVALNRPLVMSCPETEKTSAKLRLYERQLTQGTRGTFFVFGPPVALAAATP